MGTSPRELSLGWVFGRLGISPEDQNAVKSCLQGESDKEKLYDLVGRCCASDAISSATFLFKVVCPKIEASFPNVENLIKTVRRGSVPLYC